MTRHRIYFFAGAIFLIFLIGASVFITKTVAQLDDRAAMPASAERWEYLVVAGGSNVNLNPTGSSTMRKEPDLGFPRESFVLEQNLDKLGAKGWELISMDIRGGEPTYYFKRRK